MSERKIEILWTKTGDGQAHQRKRVLSVKVPFEIQSETFATEELTPDLVDAVLSLPKDPRSVNADRVKMPKPLDDLTNEVVRTQAIPLLFAEIMAAAREKAEKEDAEKAEQIAVLETFVAGGDPADVSSKLVEGGNPDYMGAASGRYTRTCRLTTAGKAVLEGHDDLLRRVEARVEEANAGIKAVNERKKEELAKTRAENEAHYAKEEEAKAKRAEQRAAEIKTWAAEHGSKRLQEQIKQGLDGWPLYLHERLEMDFPRCELDNDGEHGDPLPNPTEDQLSIACMFAARSVELGLCESEEVAFERIEIVPIRYPAPEDYDDEPETRIYATFDGYRPGSEVFATKTIRFCCEE